VSATSESVGVFGWAGAGGGGDTTPPSAPTLALASIGDGSVTLTYTPPSEDYASGQIEYDSGGNVSSTATTTAGNVTITGLTNGRTYIFTARAKDSSNNWSSRSKAVRAIPNADEALISRILAETISLIEAMNLGGTGACEVFQGRKPKPGPQAKRISINVYLGDIDQSRRTGTTGFNYFGFPVHLHVSFKRQDKNTGQSQTSLMGDYLFQLAEKLDQLRPSSLTGTFQNFFSTYSKIEDIDTETGSSSSEAVGLDPTVEGFVTVVWEFWRPQP